MTVRSYSGNAKPTTLAGAISAAATSIGLADGTGYPTGVDGPFVVTIDTGLAAEEKVLCSSRTGNTLSVDTRGWDDTTAADHDNGASVEHTFSAVDAREANEHVNADASDDPHAGYMVADSTVGASVSTAESTSSTSFGALTTAGPAQSATIGASGRALVIVTARMVGDTASMAGFMSFAVSGASTQAASDTTSLRLAGNQIQRGSAVSLVTGLTAGSNTFTAQYKVGTGGAGVTFANRDIVVIPL